jgi:hypothetical protein
MAMGQQKYSVELAGAIPARSTGFGFVVFNKEFLRCVSREIDEER